MNYKAAIFDLDGTLADSVYVWKKVDRDFFGRRNMEIPPDYTKKINSLSFEETAVFTKNEYNISESVEEIMKEWFDCAIYEYSNCVRPKDYAKEYLEYLKSKNIKIALATASPKILYKPFLENNGLLEYFDITTDVNSVAKSKEHPDIYLHCAKLLDVNSSECMVFEDILRAINGAKKAGMYTIGVYDKYNDYMKDDIQKAAHRYIHSFKEML